MVIFATAERHHGPALHQARHPELPQPAHLPDAGTAEEAPAALSLQPESRRHSCFWGARRAIGDFTDPLCAAGRQIAALPAARIRRSRTKPVEFPASFAPVPQAPQRS